MTGTDKNTLPFLMASLKEVQDTVRAYDTKAQIVGVGYIFTIGIIINLGARIANIPELTAVPLTFAWLFFIFPIAMFGAVLYPSRKVAPRLGEQASLALRTFYVEPEHIRDVDAYLAAVEAGDPKKGNSLRDSEDRRLARDQATPFPACAVGGGDGFCGSVSRPGASGRRPPANLAGEPAILASA